MISAIATPFHPLRQKPSTHITAICAMPGNTASQTSAIIDTALPPPIMASTRKPDRNRSASAPQATRPIAPQTCAPAAIPAAPSNVHRPLSNSNSTPNADSDNCADE